ncbi:Protein of unknown function [Pyronema omphalodes CBS 100304]|uniref:Uncharacterized protein n=1 Tax=Pyronema omphalodes (strain CBS 100304) TaxID=1076935 RepID=U4L1A6_PYROM|nr:Protein of unknown function [Pyronema omphalodes CBS 100304]
MLTARQAIISSHAFVRYIPTF